MAKKKFKINLKAIKKPVEVVEEIEEIEDISEVEEVEEVSDKKSSESDILMQTLLDSDDTDMIEAMLKKEEKSVYVPKSTAPKKKKTASNRVTVSKSEYEITDFQKEMQSYESANIKVFTNFGNNANRADLVINPDTKEECKIFTWKFYDSYSLNFHRRDSMCRGYNIAFGNCNREEFDEGMKFLLKKAGVTNE